MNHIPLPESPADEWAANVWVHRHGHQLGCEVSWPWGKNLGAGMVYPIQKSVSVKYVVIYDHITYTDIYIYIYIYLFTYVCLCICIYI